jgi:hypothetical protein
MWEGGYKTVRSGKDNKSMWLLNNDTLSTASQLNISQKALETLPEDSNVMPKHVGATIYN